MIINLIIFLILGVFDIYYIFEEVNIEKVIYFIFLIIQTITNLIYKKLVFPLIHQL